LYVEYNMYVKYKIVGVISRGRVSELAQAIRQIRYRLGKTTTQFGEMLGVSHATVSRYESGRLKPGYVHLGKLLQLAEGTEKNPIINRLHSLLGVTGGERVVLVELGRINRLRKVADQDIREAMGLKGLERFSDLSYRISMRRLEVDASLNTILELWLSADTVNPETRRAFEQAANFLKVALSGSAGTPEEPGEV
jgi:transcriptional regulator with XRE-family HTH domain